MVPLENKLEENWIATARSMSNPVLLDVFSHFAFWVPLGLHARSRFHADTFDRNARNPCGLALGCLLSGVRHGMVDDLATQTRAKKMGYCRELNSDLFLVAASAGWELAAFLGKPTWVVAGHIDRDIRNCHLQHPVPRMAAQAARPIELNFAVIAMHRTT